MTSYDHIKDDAQSEGYGWKTSIKCYNCGTEFWYPVSTISYNLCDPTEKDYYCTPCRLKHEDFRIVRIFNRIRRFLR